MDIEIKNCIYCDDENRMVKLLKNGLNPNYGGGWPIRLAARHGACAVVRALIQHGANPHLLGEAGASTLQLAVFSGSLWDTDKWLFLLSYCDSSQLADGAAVAIIFNNIPALMKIMATGRCNTNLPTTLTGKTVEMLAKGYKLQNLLNTPTVTTTYAQNTPTTSPLISRQSRTPMRQAASLSPRHSPVPSLHHRNLSSSVHRNLSPSVPSPHHRNLSPSVPGPHHLNLSPSVPSPHHRNLSPSVPSPHHRNLSPSLPSPHHGNLSPSVPSPHHRNLSPSVPSPHHRNLSPSVPSPHHRNLSPSVPSPHHRNLSPSVPSPHHRNLSPSVPSPHHRNLSPSVPSPHHRNLSPSVALFFHQTSGQTSLTPPHVGTIVESPCLVRR